VDNKEVLHYMASRFWPLVHTVHTPYDDNEIFKERISWKK